MTRIIVDSTCDLPKALLARFDIAVLPLSVIIEDQVYRDGVEISLDEVYEAMRAGKIPGTSQISWEDAETLFTSVAVDEDLLYLSFSAAMSGTFDLAGMVLKEVRSRYPERRLEIVDSRGGSLGSGLIAIQLGLMNEDGAGFDELLAEARWLADHVKYAFTLDDLKCALRGGRLVRAAGDLGSVLKIKPLMDVKNGRISLDKIVRGSKHSLQVIASTIGAYAGRFEEQIIGVTHADDPEKANIMIQLLQDQLPKCTVLCQRIGSVLGSHLGIGGVGVFCLDQRPPVYHWL